MLIDDNESDNYFHERVIMKNESADTVVVKQSGESAIQYLKEKIQQALLAIPERDPELWKAIKDLYRRPDITAFVSAKDSDYDGLRKFAAQLKDYNLNEK